MQYLYMNLLQCIQAIFVYFHRGIDAPESSQPFGQQAKAVLISLVEGRPLLIHVYTTDQYGRLVGDIHCNNIFIQVKLSQSHIEPVNVPVKLYIHLLIIEFVR